ncbi:MAG: hypothetical protein V7723_04785 [Sneathiella sp.]
MEPEVHMMSAWENRENVPIALRKPGIKSNFMLIDVRRETTPLKNNYSSTEIKKPVISSPQI